MSRSNQFKINDQHGRQLVWVMQLCLVVMFVIGLVRKNTGIIANTAVCLVVVQFPPILERDYHIPMSFGLTLWITIAVFLHAFGTVGLPGIGSLYQSVWWWDHLTHALSASVVAAAGYATVRALDIHYDDITLPSEFMFVFVLVFVIAFGVFWEVIEFTLSELAHVIGGEPILTQHGIADTMLDLVFDTIGACIVAIWGTAHLTGVVSGLVHRLDSHNDRS